MSSQILTSALLAVFALSALGPAVCRAEDGQIPSPSDLRNLSLEQLGNVQVVTETKEPTDLSGIRPRRSTCYRRGHPPLRRDQHSGCAAAGAGRECRPREWRANWAVGIRGLGDQFSKYVQVLIDGRSVYTPLFGGVYWNINNVMLEDIDRIEVIRGPGGTIWGANAVNGIINIITKSAADTQGALVAAGGGNVDQADGHLPLRRRRGEG